MIAVVVAIVNTNAGMKATQLRAVANIHESFNDIAITLISKDGQQPAVTSQRDNLLLFC